MLASLALISATVVPCQTRHFLLKLTGVSTIGIGHKRRCFFAAQDGRPLATMGDDDFTVFAKLISEAQIIHTIRFLQWPCCRIGSFFPSINQPIIMPHLCDIVVERLHESEERLELFALSELLHVVFG